MREVPAHSCRGRTPASNGSAGSHRSCWDIPEASPQITPKIARKPRVERRPPRRPSSGRGGAIRASWGSLRTSTSLAEERVRPLLGRVELQQAVQTDLLGGAQQGQQRLRERHQQQQPIAPRRDRDVRRRQAQPEAQVLGVSQVLLDREPSAVELFWPARRSGPCSPDPRVLHPLGPNDHDTLERRVVRRQPHAAQFKQATVGAQPLLGLAHLPAAEATWMQPRNRMMKSNFSSRRKAYSFWSPNPRWASTVTRTPSGTVSRGRCSSASS